MAQSMRRTATEVTPTAEREVTDARASRLFAAGVRNAYAGQGALWELAARSFWSGQQLWWDQWRRMTEVSLAMLVPATDRRLDERFEAVERRAAERQTETRAELERAVGELRKAQRELSQAQTQAVREVGREQRAARKAVDEAIEQLNDRIDRLTEAQDAQLDQINAALAEHAQRLSDRLGDRIQSAVRSNESARASDIRALRQQVAGLTEAVAAIRGELSTSTRERHQEQPASERTEPSGGP